MFYSRPKADVSLQKVSFVVVPPQGLRVVLSMDKPRLWGRGKLKFSLPPVGKITFLLRDVCFTVDPKLTFHYRKYVYQSIHHKGKITFIIGSMFHCCYKITLYYREYISQSSHHKGKLTFYYMQCISLLFHREAFGLF
jgi:hypothetical protein